MIKKFRFKIFNTEWEADLVCSTFKELEMFLKSSRFKHLKALENSRGMIFREQGLKPLIWVGIENEKEQRLYTLIHEIVHVVNWLHSELDIVSDEWGAHTTAHCFKQCYNQMKKWRVI